MNQLFQDSVFFGVLISLAAYGIGMLLKLKTGWSLMNTSHHLSGCATLSAG